MKRHLLAVGGLATALVVVGSSLLGVQASAAGATPRTTIMIAGDSISQGLAGDFTWRYRFAAELARQRVTDVDLVGPRTNTAGAYSHYLVGTGWDQAHAATSGTTLAREVDFIAAEVATYKPDVLITFLGTNDFLAIPRDPANATKTPDEMAQLYDAKITEVLDLWTTYINRVQAKAPSIDLVLGEVFTPRVPAEVRLKYNTALSELAQQQSNELTGSKLVVAQLDGDVWGSARYLYDTIHPTPTGETLLGQRFAETLETIDPSLFPDAIQIQRAYVPWTPPLAVKIRVVGRKVRLDWTQTTRWNAIRAVRVKFGPVKARSARVTPYRQTYAGTTWTSARLKPGKYTFRIQGSRIFMTSGWSRAYTVRIKK